MEIFKLLGTIAVDNSDANREIEETTGHAEQSEGRISGAFKKIGAALIAAFAVNKIINFGKTLVNVASMAQSAFAKVSTLLADGTNEKKYFNDIKKASNETGVAMADFSEAVYQAISASVDQEKAVGFTTKAVKLAKAGFTQTATAVDVMTTAINAYKLSADDANHISDVLITTQNLGKTSVDELASSMGQVIPLASAYNVNIDNLSASYAQLTKGGIATSESTTYLKGMFTELADSGSNVSQILKKETGKSFSELMDSGQSLGDVIETIYTSVDKDSTAFANLWSSTEAGTGALSLASAGAEEFNTILDAMVNSTGATEKAYAKMSDTFDEKVAKLKTNIQNLGVTIGTQMLPSLSHFVSGLTFVSHGFEQVLSDSKSFAQFGNEIVAGIQKSITTGLPKLMESGAKVIAQIGDGLRNGLPQLVSHGLDILLNLSSTLRANSGQMIQSGLNLIVNLAEGLMDSLPSLISKVPTIVSNIAGIINDNAPKMLTTAAKLILTLAMGLIKAIPSLIANIPKIIKAIVDVFLAYNWLNLGKTIINFFKNGIVSTLGLVKTASGKIKDTVVNAIKELPKRLLNLAKDAVNKLVSILKHTASVKSAASAIKNEIVRVLAQLPAKLLEIGSNLVKGLWNGISNAKDWIISKVKGFGKGILDGLKDFFGIHSPSKVMETVIGKNLALGVIKGLEKQKKTVLNASKKNLGKSIADGLISGIENAKANAKKKSSEISNLIIKEAKNRLEKGRTYKKMNLADEVAYWDAVRKQCKKGTKAKLEADKQYLAAKKKLATEQKKIEKELVENAEKRLDKYKTYNNLSLKDEVEYWDKIRKAARAGTEARLEADKRYFEAKENYNEQLIQAEKDYSDAVDAANQKITDRTNAILSAFNLFDEFTQKVDEENPLTSDTLINNLQSQVDALTEWQKNIDDLQGKIGDTELFKAVQEMGISSLQQVKAINTMTEEQLQKYVELYNQRQQQAQEQATAELGGEVLDEINAAMDTYQKTLDSLDKTTKKKYANIAKTIKDKTNEAATVTLEKLTTMLNSFTTGTKGMDDTTKAKFDSILTKIQSNMKSAVATVQSAVAQMQAALASVGAAETETTVTAKANVSKHAKGGILTEPTIFGYSPKSNTYHLGGEAGAEAIAPIDVLQGYVKAAVAEENAEQVNLLQSILTVLQGILGKDTAVYLNSKEISRAVNRDLGVIL